MKTKLILFLWFFILLSQSAIANEITYLKIGTGSPGGTYFPLGGTIGNIISQPDMKDQGTKLIAVAHTTEGSVENIYGLLSGRFELALVQADIAYWSYKSEGIFKKDKPFNRLRAIANLYTECVHIVTLKKYDIRTLDDLKDKRISIGQKNSGSIISAKLILEKANLGFKDFKEVFFYPPGKAGDEMVQGNVDAFFVTAGFPTPSLVNLSKDHDIFLIPIPEKVQKEIIYQFPYFSEVIISQNIYGSSLPTRSLGIGAQLYATSELEGHVVKRVLQALWKKESRDLLIDTHPTGIQIRKVTATRGLPVPLHDAAIEFYSK